MDNDELLLLLYQELRKLAHSKLRKLKPGQSLQTTDLVHEAYLRLRRRPDVQWNGKRHFFGAAAMAMRDIMVESARRKGALKRGGDQVQVDVPLSLLASPVAMATTDVLGVRADDDHRPERGTQEFVGDAAEHGGRTAVPV